MKTPLTKASLKQHLTYSWWQYALLALVCVFGWNLIFTMTAHRAPEDKKLTVYLYAFGETAELQTWMEATRAGRYPDQEQFDVVQVAPDETNGMMVLSTHMAAGEGDLIVLPRDQFYTYARDGFFIQLEGVPGLTDAFAAAEVSVDKGWRLLSNPDGEGLSDERHLYGLPIRSIPILSGAVVSGTEYYVGIRLSCGNEENAIALLKDICRTNADIAAVWPEDERPAPQTEGEQTL